MTKILTFINHTGTICKKRYSHRFFCVNSEKTTKIHVKKTDWNSDPHKTYGISPSWYKSTSGILHSSSTTSFCQLLSKAAMVIWLCWWWNCFLSGSAGKMTWLRTQRLMISPADLHPDFDSTYGDTTYLSYLFVDLSGSLSAQCSKSIYN